MLTYRHPADELAARHKLDGTDDFEVIELTHQFG